MFENQPKGLFALALANTGERFGYYTMLAVFALFLRANYGLSPLAVFALFLRANYGLSPALAGTIYSAFLMLVYFFPLIGGIMADKFGFGRMVTTGIMIMFAGYLLLSVPLGGDTVALVVMLAALLLIGFGTGLFKGNLQVMVGDLYNDPQYKDKRDSGFSGLFKGNLQVMVGDLYNDPQYKDKRDSGFSIFYMAINIGALFAPTAAIKIKEYAETSLGYSSNDAYHFSFAVACASLILSIAIYYIFRSTFRHTEGGTKKAAAADAAPVEELSKEETKQRIVALCLVFAVVIFFWMAFHLMSSQPIVLQVFRLCASMYGIWWLLSSLFMQASLCSSRRPARASSFPLLLFWLLLPSCSSSMMARK